MNYTKTAIAPTSTTDREIVIARLTELGYPALPVAPYQDPYKYPKVTKEIKDERGAIKSWKCCPLTKDFKPEPLYCGKNPSFLDASGTPHTVFHQSYQDSLPSASDLKTWFIHPSNGIGTLGGFNGSVWIDWDVKDFDSQTDSDTQFEAWLSKSPQLKTSWLEQTHSGGYRVLVSSKNTPDFTNFTLEPSGKKRGEALGLGRFTVLAPTVGVSGNAYQLITERVAAIEVESLESIGIYTTKKAKVANKTITATPLSFSTSVEVTAIALRELGHPTSKDVLRGVDVDNDRSDSLTTAIREWYGWENWARANGLSINGSATDLALEAGIAIGLDEAKIDRILESIKDRPDCLPATSSKGGEKACWKVIHGIDKEVFKTLCPIELRDEIYAEWKEYAIERDGYDKYNLTPLEAATRGLPLPLEQVIRKNKPPTHRLPSEAATARYVAVSMKSELGFHSDEKQFYGFVADGGYWELKDDHQLKRIVGRVIKNTDKGDAHDLMHSTFIRGVLYHLPMDAENTPRAVDKNIVPFLGAWFDIEVKKWVEPTNEHFVTSPLPITPIVGDYSRIENWLKSAVKGDEKTYDLLRCLFWLVLAGDTSRQVYYEIVGLGGTGKGTLCELLKAMVGDKYSRSVSFSTLEKSQFQTATLHQKRVVILPDQNKYSGSCEILRQYTGGDDLPLEMKGNATLGNFKAAGIMIVTANDFLRFSDGTEALDRRRIPIKFDVKATEENKAQYPDFTGYLAEALPQWSTHILSLDRAWVYQTIAKRRAFTLEARVEQMLEANNVAQWLDSCVAVADGQKTSVGNRDMHGSLYSSYVDFCQGGGFNPVNIKNFRKEVETLLYTSLGWKESEVYFKRDTSGQFGYGLILSDGKIEIGQNPITRAEIKREPIEEEKF